MCMSPLQTAKDERELALVVAVSCVPAQPTAPDNCSGWAQEVNRAVSSLDAEGEAYLRQAYFEGMAQATIARRNGVPAIVVAQAVARALHEVAFLLIAAP